jgi:hypothetical protein
MTGMTGLAFFCRREWVAVKASRVCLVRRVRNRLVLLMSLRLIVADVDADSIRRNGLLRRRTTNMTAARRMDASLQRAIDWL